MESNESKIILPNKETTPKEIQMTNEGKGGLGGKLNWVTIIGAGFGGINDGGHMGVPDYMLLVGVHQGLCWWWMWYFTKSGGSGGRRDAHHDWCWRCWVGREKVSVSASTRSG